MNALLDHPLLLFVLTLFILLVAFEIGHRVSPDMKASEEYEKQWKLVRDALSVLLSLLLGFTLAMSLTRYDKRRDLVVQEANAIGTTYLRAQLLPPANGTRSQELLRHYVTTRLKFFQAGTNRELLHAAEDETKRIQNDLWRECVEVTKTDRSAVAGGYVVSLNQAIDLDAERLAAYEGRVPLAVWLLIVIIAFFEILAQGAVAKVRVLLPMVALPFIIAVACTLISDLDTSRSGMIVVDQRSMERLAQDIGAK